MNPTAIPQPQNHRHSFWTAFCIALAVAGLWTLYRSSETARDVTWETTRAVLGFLCTPFILEGTSIIVGICILMAIRHHQDKREGDGWVYLATQEPDEADLPKSLTERLQSVVMTDKPSEPDDVASRHAVIEGYLELGMGAQALEDFLSTPWPTDLPPSLLHARVLAANLDTDRAIAKLRYTATRFPAEKQTVATAALEISAWVELHLHQPPLAKLWRDEAARILQATVV